MVPDRTRVIVEHLRRLSEAAQARDTPDQDLVGAFVATQSEAAFSALVKRHGPMVLDVCRRVLGNVADAEDAFQATFLVLARKAASLRDRQLVSSWLYGVAQRTARKALTTRARRAAHEQAAPAARTRDPLAELSVREAQQLVDREIAGLPEKYQAPLVLCCLEGLARDEAARQLGWPVALLKSRLEQARQLLRARLARHGLTLPAGVLAVELLGTSAQAALPAALTTSTIRAAVVVATGGSAAGIATAQALFLSEGMVRAMFLTKMKWCMAALATFVTLGALAAAPLLGRKVVSGDEPRGGPAVQPGPAVRPLPVQPGVRPGPKTPLQGDAVERWGKAEVVVTALLTNVKKGPVGLSEPPLWSHGLDLMIRTPIRGSFKKGDMVTGHHGIRQAKEPTFPVGMECLVALKQVRGGWTVLAIQPATVADVAQAQLACALPLGWTVAKGRLLSPWAGLGSKAWPADAKGKGQFVCAETGRPSLMVGEGVEMTAEPLPPKVKLKYGNPDGDGEYRVMVKNTSDKAVTIPALLTVGGKVLWDESLVILCQGKVYTIPGAQGVKTAPRPATLKPGESISTVVNALKLQGPEWPRGGYRIEFQFALGEKSATRSFYYLSKHHDRIREEGLGKKPAEQSK
jgi:RNA polymerase sigma factor (sigma-70 family)